MIAKCPAPITRFLSLNHTSQLSQKPARIWDYETVRCLLVPTIAAPSRRLMSTPPSCRPARRLQRRRNPYGLGVYRAPLLVSHSRTVLAYNTDATVLLSGEKATASTQLVWPLCVCGAA